MSEKAKEIAYKRYSKEFIDESKTMLAVMV
ncbi:hypothetical protein X557_01625 [Francisella tularensis subsp. holarctica PHIT-FT049]|nr:hypothetical protein NE061598_08335 [Francisella tularensis subsp. tularensis NE061598]AHH45858.1 hypothetical protein X557_01625 [Francisella tularensis subsp. holarctica PHIT-FT049]EKM85750.1 hypothetical protein B343_08493 [Francisella tularensis subsp. tularensis 80700075]EKM87065.1 hypothetical protein B344_03896 [Francisella tularensis subsp. tularensis 831]EKM87256.1 hypothetical protein B345_03949 [Francisella tularensis subsp. tularensis AS_713]EKM91319.1 hypothetical protein B341_